MRCQRCDQPGTPEEAYGVSTLRCRVCRFISIRVQDEQERRDEYARPGGLR